MMFNKIEAKFAALKSNKVFETFVVGIILFSAVVIGLKTYSIPPVLTQVIQVLDRMITLFFLTEITIRFIGDEEKRKFFTKGWNIFDTVIVVVSLIPIQDSEMAIVGRLVRIFRVLRMVSVIPELRILLNSLIKALPQLGYVMLLMFIIFYIYAAVGSTFFHTINPDLWGNIAIALLTLFRVMTFEDWTDVMYETQDHYSLSWIYYLSFIFFTAFAFLNMVIGIVVNVMEEEHRAALKEDLQQEADDIGKLREEIAELKQIILAQSKS